MDSDYGSDIELTPDDEELLRILDSTPLPPPSAAPPPTTNFVNELQNSQGGRDGNNEDDAGGNAAVILYPTLPVLSDSSNSVHYDRNETGGFFAPHLFDGKFSLTAVFSTTIYYNYPRTLHPSRDFTTSRRRP